MNEKPNYPYGDKMHRFSTEDIEKAKGPVNPDEKPPDTPRKFISDEELAPLRNKQYEEGEGSHARIIDQEELEATRKAIAQSERKLEPGEVQINAEPERITQKEVSEAELAKQRLEQAKKMGEIHPGSEGDTTKDTMIFNRDKVKAYFEQAKEDELREKTKQRAIPPTEANQETESIALDEKKKSLIDKLKFWK